MTPLKFFGVAALIVLLGAIQNTNWLMVGGTKPDLLLAGMIALAFFTEHIWQYGFFILLAGAMLKTQGFFAPELVVFTLLLILAAWIAAVWRAKPVFMNLLLTGGATIAFYLFTGPSYIFSYPGPLALELGYNLILGAMIFKIFETCLGHKKAIFSSN